MLAARHPDFEADRVEADADWLRRFVAEVHLNRQDARFEGVGFAELLLRSGRLGVRVGGNRQPIMPVVREGGPGGRLREDPCGHHDGHGRK